MIVIYILHVCMGMVLFYFVSKAYSIVDRPDSYIIDSYPIHVWGQKSLQNNTAIKLNVVCQVSNKIMLSPGQLGTNHK